ncbi:MAG: ribonuclease E inhibitor RraB [Jannaschia sp.]
MPEENATGFDYGAQRAETEARWAEMVAAGAPSRGLLDLHFVPGDAPDAIEFMGWLEDEGFDVEHYPAAAFEDGDETETLEAQTPPMDLSAEAIHAVERRVTEAALRHGYRPDGWGFIAA